MMCKRAKYNAAVGLIAGVYIIPWLLGDAWNYLVGPVLAMWIGVLWIVASKYENDSKIAEFIVWSTYIPGIFEFTKFHKLFGSLLIFFGALFLCLNYPEIAGLALLYNVYWSILYLVAIIVVGGFVAALIL
ncbi:hypothetical protein [Oceanidesulfovibrio marinus]|uniref:SPW repeat-containing protein n=1 Tax=Oceanidesulfovibrio marinus TaxID=370038 RepID=A0ABX6NIC3_9BACT|nr:hypothetical protein [Oceanidesulfovibrio marinus]QJT10394.1 hypothetical protein E8L03_16290 [Oceanidesulfovibrio marinus]